MIMQLSYARLKEFCTEDRSDLARPWIGDDSCWYASNGRVAVRAPAKCVIKVSDDWDTEVEKKKIEPFFEGWWPTEMEMEDVPGDPVETVAAEETECPVCDGYCRIDCDCPTCDVGNHECGECWGVGWRAKAPIVSWRGRFFNGAMLALVHRLPQPRMLVDGQCETDSCRPAKFVFGAGNEGLGLIMPVAIDPSGMIGVPAEVWKIIAGIRKEGKA